MEKVGIICEYNPFHNGHVYHIDKVRELYPGAAIVLVLGGYFLERGEVSVMSKWTKTEVALDHGVDLIMELPVLYGTNSGDYFAYHAIKVLNECGVEAIVFGSECSDVSMLTKIAIMQEDENFNSKVRTNLKNGSNYPSSLSTALNVNLGSNDILGVSYIKAIRRINPKIEAVTILRTNDYGDVESSDDIVSAQNIRNKLNLKEDISKFIPYYPISHINDVDYVKLFDLIRYRIMTERHLERFLGVDEGLENRLKCMIDEVSDFKSLVDSLKSKRYTASRIRRMLIHILLGIEKEDMEEEHDQYRILGFNEVGRNCLKELDSPRLVYRYESRVHDIELVASKIYYDLTGDESVKLETLNKPINKEKV